MATFLNSIATLYYTKIEEEHDAGLSMKDLLFVFPNRRAGLFFKQEIRKVAKKNIFLPRISDINRFTESLSNLQIANDIDLLIRLYKTYYSLAPDKAESFDDFITRGTSILSDFNDIDKFLVDAQALFINISDLKDLTDNTLSLSESQRKAIETYLNVVIPDNETLSFKKMYVSIWNKLYDLYHKFRQSLKEDGFAYEGMMFREVIDQLKIGSLKENFDFKRIIFVGFNNLNPTEKELLLYFKKEGIADYYFDYPCQFDNNSPFASTVAKSYKNNLKEFPSLYGYQQPEEKGCAKFSVYGTPSTFEQGKIAGEIIHGIYNGKGQIFTELAESTAIILADENILSSAVENLPNYVNVMNITMGYPLRQSPIANLIENIILMQTDAATNNNRFYHKPLINILTHAYIQRRFKTQSNNIIKQINKDNYIRIEDVKLLKIIESESFELESDRDFFNTLFTARQSATNGLLNYLSGIIEMLKAQNTENDEEIKYRFEYEYLLQYGNYISRLKSYIKKYEIVVAPKTLHLLLNRLTGNLKVQFSGEPLKGFQIMGMLESRLLDFENIILLGFNDENIPGSRSNNSMIPYSLRKAYNLPTNELSDAIYAYNFYRMSYRAKNIHLIYNSRHDDTKSEISRFYYQIKYLMPLMFDNNQDLLSEKILSIKSGGAAQQVEHLTSINKNPQTLNILDQYKGVKSFSPSRLKHYIGCPLKFYFSTIVELKEPNEVEESTQASLLGNIYHKAMELYYQKRKEPEKISQQEIDTLVNEAIVKNDSKTELKGFILLIKNVVCQLVDTTIRYDINNRHSFRYHNSEIPFDCTFNGINLNGVIDRIDESDNGMINLIDYKTTRPTNKVYNLMELFNSTESASNEIFQVILYCYLYLNGTVNKKKCEEEGKRYEKTNVTASELKPQLYNIYHMASHVMNSNAGVELEPLKIIVPNDLIDGDFPYTAEWESFNFDKENVTVVSIENYALIQKPFEWGLAKMFYDLFDPHVPFNGLDDKKISDGCRYCPYINLCGNANKISTFF